VSKPLIGVPTDHEPSAKGTPSLKCSVKYPRSVWDAADCLPVMLPAWDFGEDLEALVARLDGVLLTGATSNVHPDHYRSTEIERAKPFDESRDALTLPLIEAVLDAGKPLFAICRGFQELNVALGGSLHPKLQEVDGRFDHRMPKSDDPDVRYGAVHDIEFLDGGKFHQIIGSTHGRINSLHGQGINRISDRLVAEGHAPDGTIEAVSVKDASSFALGVQWHPEYRPLDNDISASLFRAFGAAARA